MTSLFIQPVSAVVNADSLTVSSVNVTQFLGETETANSPTITLSFLASNPGDTMTVQTPTLVMPATNNKWPVLKLIQATNSNVDTSSVLDGALPLGSEIRTGMPTAYVSASGNTVAVTAKFKLYLDSPTLAGTYRIRVVPNIAGGGGSVNALSIDVIFTVVDPKVASADTFINKPTNTSSTSDDFIFACSEVNLSAPFAVIRQTPKNAAGIPTYNESLTAVLTGVGVLASGALGFTTGNTYAVVLQIKATDAINIYPDGRAGVGTFILLSERGTEVARKSFITSRCVNPPLLDVNSNFTGAFVKGEVVKLSYFANAPGNLSFTANGKKIPNCTKMTGSVAPVEITCNWKPAVSGSFTIRATYVSPGLSGSPHVWTQDLAIGRRSGRR
jgi:hypothetical protein